jgi:hypothetical protein
VIPSLRKPRGVPVVVRVELGAAATRAIATAASLLSGAIVAAAAVPPRIDGLSLIGAALLALGIVRLTAS